MRKCHWTAVGVAILAFTTVIARAARADPVADFYHGKDLRLIVSASVGGGYDIYARTVAKYLGRHLPGNPTIVPQNMPAGGGLAAANHIYNIADKDGSVIAAIQNTVPFEPFFGNKQAQFDADEIRLARHADDRNRRLHRLARLENPDPAGRQDP